METKNWYSLDESAELIAQSLFSESEEEDDKNILERYVTKSEHKKALIKSAEAGEVILHSSYLVPIPANEILFHLNNNAGLLKANLENYASDKLGITLILNVAPAPEVIETDTGQRQELKKAHYMDSPIKNARAIASNKNDVHEIWGLLLKNAESETCWSPISDSNEYGIISYDKTFTKAALRKYLKKRQVNND